MIHSYLDSADYGYDQINVRSCEFNQVLKTLDSNSIHHIDNIREREIRMFNKLNEYQPQSKKKTQSKDYNPNLFSIDGERRIQERRYVKDHIEDYYQGSGNNFKDSMEYPHPNEQVTASYPESMYRAQTPHFTPKKKQCEPEGFHDRIIDSDNIENLHDDIEHMKQKNNILVMLIFFLTVIVLVQYAKSNNDPVRLIFVSDKNQDKSREDAKPADPAE